MPETKPKRKSKRWWGLVAAILGAVATFFGVDVNVEFLADGIQIWQDLNEILIAAGTVLSAWGFATASKPLETISDTVRKLLGREPKGT